MSPAASPLSGTPTTLPGKRLPTILVVEDHESNVIVLREMLESYGYHVLVAHTGSEGLARAFDDLPVLVLMDIHLPGMSGLEAIGRLRADARTSDIPIITLTALVFPDDRERCMAAGANEYLAKPVNMRMLLEMIERLLSE